MSTSAELPTATKVDPRSYAEWYFWAMTSLGAAPKQAWLGAGAAMIAIADGEAPQAVAEAARKAVDGAGDARSGIFWSRTYDREYITYQEEYVRQREAGADAERAHAAAAAAVAEDEKRVRKANVVQLKCIQGHGFEGARTEPCPVCGSPSVELVESVRSDARKGLLWAVPLTVGIPLAAVLVGVVNPIEIPGIVALVAGIAWVGGIANLFYNAYLLLRPVAAARSRLKRAG